MAKKDHKNVKNIFLFVLNKYQSVTHVSTFIFQGLVRNRSVTLVIKKLWAILDFFTQPGLFTALYLTLCIIFYFFLIL